MRYREFVTGTTTALVLGGLVFGSLSLALAETPAPSPTQPLATAASTVRMLPSTTQPAAPSALPLSRPTSTPHSRVTATACPARPGWRGYTTRDGDTLILLAQVSGTSADELRTANCLGSADPPAGTNLLLPPTPTATLTISLAPAATGALLTCTSSAGWTEYTILSGDTLGALALQRGINLAEVLRVNCIDASSILQPGQRIFLPPIPSATPLNAAPAGTKTS